MKRLQLHPVCKLFPELPEPELRQLADDIKANGLQNPIVLLDGKILDGRNRDAACRIAGVKPSFVKWDGDGSPVEWVISQNLMRRHLTASQRAVVALDLLSLLEKEAKQRQRLSNSYRKNGRLAQKCADRNGTGRASEAAARIVRSSSRYVEIVKSIKGTAPELVERIRSGEVTVSEADKQLRQNQAVSRARSNGKRKGRNRSNQDEANRVISGDCLNLIPTLEDGSVTLVLSSPPYAQQRDGQYKGVSESEYPAWTAKWMELLWDKLTDDGSVMIVIRPNLQRGAISDYVLRTRLALRDDGWNECEELIWLKPDAPPLGNMKRPRRIWESILWFSKTTSPFTNLTACGKESSRIGFAGSLRFGIGGNSPISGGQEVKMRNGVSRCSDVFVAPVGCIEKGIQHPAMFPVSLAEQLILTFSRESDLVVDPFCGSGTTLIAAKRLKQDFRGFDRDLKYVKIALSRLAQN